MLMEWQRGPADYYFVNRTQRVKIGNYRSPWETIYKGAAQGSIMEPFCFNVLCYVLIYFS